MIELSAEDVVDMSIVLEEAIDNEAGQIAGIEDDLRWAETEAARFHMEHVRGLREGRIAKYKALLAKLGYPYDG